MRLAYGFATASPVKAVAAAYGVTQKTVRAFYLECRAHLTKPHYRRWHRLSLLIPDLPDDLDIQAAAKVAFFDVIAECHANETCHRNYRLWNRKSRFCRKCPLPGKFTQRPREVEAIRTIEAVQDLYRLLGLRSEQGADPVSNFRNRLLHLSVLNEVRAKSKTQADGNLDPSDMSYEGIGSFLLLLMDDLAGTNAELSANPTSPKSEPPQPQDPVSDSPNEPELVDWLLDDGTVIWLPVGEKPSR